MGRTVYVPTFFVWQNVLFSVGLVFARAARKDPATKFSGTETAELEAKVGPKETVCLKVARASERICCCQSKSSQFSTHCPSAVRHRPGCVASRSDHLAINPT